MAGIKVTNMAKFFTLVLIYQKPRHGYELLQTVSERLGKDVSPSQMYPFLQDLEKNGMIRSAKRGGRGKHTVTLTPHGKKFVRSLFTQFDMIVESALQSSLVSCTHCHCQVYKGAYKRKNKSFCCEACADAWQQGRHK